MVEVEVDLANGVPAVILVGLPDAVVRQSVDRVRAAVVNSGAALPQRRITIGLSPAAMPKQGSGFDLALAAAVLAAAGDGAGGARSTGWCCWASWGSTAPSAAIRGVLPAVLAAARAGHRQVVVPAANAAEAALVDGIEVLPGDHAGRAGRPPRRPDAADPARAAVRCRPRRPCPTWATWSGRPPGGGRSRSPPPAGTTCS